MATPTMKSAKKMYEDMLTPPDKPSLAHSTKAQSLADKMGPAMAKGGYVRAADGITKRGKTRGRIV